MVFGSTHKVRSHRLGRRRKKGGSRMVVAPWIVITLVCVLVAAGMTWGFVTLMRSGCDGPVYRVAVAAAPTLAKTLEDAAQEWEATQPEASTGQCIGAEVRAVSAYEASKAIGGVWDTKVLGPVPIAWVPDSQAWAAWMAASETTAGYVDADPLVLGEAASVLAVPESTATSLGWVGGQPPSWADVLAEAQAGTVDFAAANPRTSTEGLVAMLNATGDGSGGFASESMAAWNGAIASGSMLDDADEQLAAYAEAGGSASVFTALDYQVEDFNAEFEPEDPLVPVSPAGTVVSAVATYQVLGGPWVSDSDAAIAEAFGDHLRAAVDSGSFEDAELRPVEDAAAALAQTSPGAVAEAVGAWKVGREDLHVLFLVDRSSGTDAETVEYGGEAITAGDAAVRTAVATVAAMESTSRAGVWSYGVGAGGDEPYVSVTGLTELSDNGRESVTEDLYDVSEESFEGGSPLYDTLVAAAEFMNGEAVDGSRNLIVVLTNSSKDEVSAGTAADTAAVLSGLDGPTVVYTVGFGETSPENLSTLAAATGGSYVDAPASGGVLAAIGG